MKTFIAAVIIFALLCCAIFGIYVFVMGRVSALSALALALPEDAADFTPPSASLLRDAEEFFFLWDKSMRVFPYIMGYEMLERADEAALSMLSYAKSGERAEFAAAKARFLDSIARIRELFGLNLASIA